MKYKHVPLSGWIRTNAHWSDLQELKNYFDDMYLHLEGKPNKGNWNHANKGEGYAWNFQNGKFNVWSVALYSSYQEMLYGDLIDYMRKSEVKKARTFTVTRFLNNKYVTYCNDGGIGTFKDPSNGTIISDSSGNTLMYRNRNGLPEFILITNHESDNEGNLKINSYIKATNVTWNQEAYEIEIGKGHRPDNNYSSLIGSLDTVKGDILRENRIGDKSRFVAIMQTLRDSKYDHLIPKYLMNFYRQYIKGAFPKFDVKWELNSTPEEDKKQMYAIAYGGRTAGKQAQMIEDARPKMVGKLDLSGMLMGTDSYNPHPYSADHPSQAPIQDLLGSDDDIDLKTYVCENVPKRVWPHHGAVYSRKKVDRTKSAKKPILFQVKTRIINL